MNREDVLGTSQPRGVLMGRGPLGDFRTLVRIRQEFRSLTSLRYTPPGHHVHLPFIIPHSTRNLIEIPKKMQHSAFLKIKFRLHHSNHGFHEQPRTQHVGRG